MQPSLYTSWSVRLFKLRRQHYIYNWWLPLMRSVIRWRKASFLSGLKDERERKNGFYTLASNNATVLWQHHGPSDALKTLNSKPLQEFQYIHNRGVGDPFRTSICDQYLKQKMFHSSDGWGLKCNLCGDRQRCRRQKVEAPGGDRR